MRLAPCGMPGNHACLLLSLRRPSHNRGSCCCADYITAPAPQKPSATLSSYAIHGSMGFAKGSTHPTSCKVLAAALARMRRYRTHHPHRSCGWLRQAKAAESLIAVPAFYFPAAQRFRDRGCPRRESRISFEPAAQMGAQRVRARGGPMTGSGVIRHRDGYGGGSMIRPTGCCRYRP
jgi:hypothetical protein